MNLTATIVANFILIGVAFYAALISPHHGSTWYDRWWGVFLVSVLSFVSLLVYGVLK